LIIDDDPKRVVNAFATDFDDVLQAIEPNRRPTACLIVFHAVLL
jgi:hypothetical protein